MRHLIELPGLSREDADRLGRRVWALIRHHFHAVPEHTADADELFQIAALAIVGAHRRFDRSRGASFETWALMKARYGIQDELRRLTHTRSSQEDHGLRFVPLDTPLPGYGGLTVADLVADGFEFADPFECEDLTAALARLPERLRLVLALRFWDEMTQLEIGAVLGVTDSRVCQLLAEGLRRLRLDPALIAAR